MAAVNFMKDVDGSAFKFFSEIPNDDEEDDDIGEEDKGGKSGDIFHLEKIEMIEKERFIILEFRTIFLEISRGEDAGLLITETQKCGNYIPS